MPRKLLLVAVFALAHAACVSATTTTPAPAAKPEQTKERRIGLGRQHKPAEDLYKALREEAKGGQQLTAATIPDWSGVYTRTPVPGFAFDPDQPAGGLPTAKLTPEYQAKLMKRIDDLKK